MMKPSLIRILSAIAACTAWFSWAADVPYPSKPVRVIVSLSPGSGGDLATRTVTARFSEAFGQQFIVDNRVGFSGNIGAETAARANADGYTLLVIYAGSAISQSYHKDLKYRLDDDFVAVGQFAAVPLALVVFPGLGVKTLSEFVALARSKPKQLHYPSPGNGSLPHLSARLFETSAGVELRHVPYKGTAQAVSELVGGQTAATFAAVPTALPLVVSGRLRLLGITTAKRSPLVTDWPTLAEAGLNGFDVSQWYGLVAPAGSPVTVVNALGLELGKIVRNPEARAALMKRGIDPVMRSPAEFGTFIKAEIGKWADVVKSTRE